MIDVWGVPVIAEVQDILDVLRAEVRAQGVDLLRDIKPTADNVMVTCPSHKGGTERKPSLGVLTVDTRRGEKLHKAGTCNCFVCGYTADLPELISFCYGLNDAGMFGYKWITERFVNLTIESRRPLKLDMSRNTQTSSEVKYIPEEVLASYRFIHPYMYERKLNDKVISYFDIGYDQKTQSLTFPVHDHKTGQVALIQRRAIGRKVFLNDDGADKGDYVYGLYQVYKNLSWITELYVCESPLDALRLWTFRIPAVALMGASFTERQVKLLRAVPIRKFVLALDNPIIDEAGRKATAKLEAKLNDIKVLFRLLYPEAVKDTGEMSDEQVENRQIILM